MEGVEQSINRSVDTAVNDLEAGQMAAIFRCYGLCTVFLFPRGILDTLLIEAHDTLLVSLPRKGIAI